MYGSHVCHREGCHAGKKNALLVLLWATGLNSKVLNRNATQKYGANGSAGPKIRKHQHSVIAVQCTSGNCHEIGSEVHNDGA